MAATLNCNKNGTMIWSRQLRTDVSLSTIEAEYIDIVEQEKKFLCLLSMPLQP